MAKQTINNGDTGLAARTKINENFTESYAKTQNDAGTTYWDTKDATYPDQLIGKTPATGTGLMLQLFNDEATPLPTFQVDASGNLFNNGNYQLVTKDTNNLFIGTESSHPAYTSGAQNNVLVGYVTGKSIVSADKNVFVGAYAGETTTNSANNTVVGYFAGHALVSDSANSLFGVSSGASLRGSNNVFLGAYSGFKQVSVSNMLLINNYQITDAATELTDSLIVGTFDADPDIQWVDINGYLSVRTGINWMNQVTPTGTADAQGNQGDTQFDDSYMYYKSSAGWKRTALSTF